MQSTITVWVCLADDAPRQRLVRLAAAQGWECLLPQLSDTAALLQEPPEICFYDAAHAATITEMSEGLGRSVLVMLETDETNADTASQPVNAEHHLAHLVMTLDTVSDASLLEALTTSLNLRRFESQFAATQSAEPITQLPRHAELMQSVQRYKGQTMGLIAAQVDHAQHLYANLDPVSRTDLLSALSKHLHESLPRSAEVGILDAACFAVWLPGATAGELPELANTLCERGRQPLAFRNGQVHFSLSCGFAFAQAMQEPHTLWQEAWTAKDSAQQAGGNVSKAGTGNSHVEQSIPEALAHHEFSLLLQPQYNIAGAELRGVECLLRWEGMEVGSLAPDHFIPIAERSGQMARVGDWVLERASCESATWLEHLVSPIKLGINISPQQFTNNAIVEQIERLSRDQWLDPAILELEMSHDNLLHVIDQHRHSLFGLRDMGVHIAIDNLGTGLVDTEKLLRCPADTLKIDRSLVARVEKDDAARRLIGQICELGPRFELRIVAVGIETESQRQTLAELGCVDAQGFLFSPPVPLEEFQQYLARSLTPDGHIRTVDEKAG